MTMGAAQRHKLIGGLLLIWSVFSLLLFLRVTYFAAPLGIDGQAPEAALRCGRSMEGAMVQSNLRYVGRIIVLVVLLLTAGLAAWNLKLCRRQP